MKKPPFDPGVFRSKQREGISSTEVVAAILSLLWIGVVFLVIFVIRPQGTGTDLGSIPTILTFVAMFLPLAIIWVAAVSARTARQMRQESAELRGSLDKLQALMAQQQARGAIKSDADMAQKLEEIEARQSETEEVIATFSTVRDGAIGRNPEVAAALKPEGEAPRKTGEMQPALALGTPAEHITPPISVADFIRALHFPEDENDKEGFRALRAGLADRDLGRLIRAAEDVLTLLSHDGIYMDDLRPDRAKPEIWRKFAGGERGRSVAALAGVRDRSCLALTLGRMKSDMIFRDAAHHFLRQFDKTFAEFAQNATDEDLANFAQTRTARAFMLLGRVAGTFD